DPRPAEEAGAGRQGPRRLLAGDRPDVPERRGPGRLPPMNHPDDAVPAAGPVPVPGPPRRPAAAETAAGGPLPASHRLGVVAIGRNEGERLRRCLASVLGRGLAVVYVDSNSTDGSAALARSLGAEVVELDTSRPICVPRARNEGFERLCRLDPDLGLVQFVDRDCEGG